MYVCLTVKVCSQYENCMVPYINRGSVRVQYVWSVWFWPQVKEKKPHIKKPLNAFMIFMKTKRAEVIKECTLKESAAINQILGKMVSEYYSIQWFVYIIIYIVDSFASCHGGYYLWFHNSGTRWIAVNKPRTMKWQEKRERDICR